ncbi:hypothetical protein F5B22DRAFT_644898 [Xylaria bambusicola]|uniref:uncharacterized protein n=1 Tax=Xylaria bambusicola TaxID=326684 RepID=UPI00200750DF|nr:uncharacterized protein F5B22DRAFT_644898 [Xylaria bambusicola]KAI0518136.1 hypothetical protein F5B22DRAFT_644898 [Xylaria bambusicola]
MADMGAETKYAAQEKFNEMISIPESPHDQYSVAGRQEEQMEWTPTLVENLTESKPEPIYLANELLIYIFELARGDRNYVGSLEIQTIQAIRLTCRRFNELSSHLLLRNLKVNLTRSSLDCLDEISRHPLISKGIETIDLYLSPSHFLIAGYSIRGFAAAGALALSCELFCWRHTPTTPSFLRQVTNHTLLYKRAINMGDALAISWAKVARHGVDPNCEDDLLIAREYKKYCQLYREYKNTADSSAQIIATAMMRMPSATRIVVKDFRREPRIIYPEDLVQSDSLPHHLISQGYEWWLIENPPEHLPLHVLGDLLLAVQQLGHPLKSLDFVTPPTMSWLPTSRMATTPESTMLRHALAGLKSFVYRPAIHRRLRGPFYKVPEMWTEFGHFLLGNLHPESIQRIELDFYFLPAQLIEPRFSMASILTSYSWPKLQQLSFHGSFHFRELKAIVEPLGQDVDLQWFGYLMSGSWVEVLDFLRERNTSTQRVGDFEKSNQGLINGGLGESYGQEYQLMSPNTREYIFHSPPDQCANDATLYIQGLTEHNPVRAWSMSGLEGGGEHDI